MKLTKTLLHIAKHIKLIKLATIAAAITIAVITYTTHTHTTGEPDPDDECIL